MSPLLATLSVWSGETAGRGMPRAGSEHLEADRNSSTENESDSCDQIRNLTVKENRQMNDVKLQDAQAEEKKQKGASLVEYALLVALIAVIAIVAIRAVGMKVSQRFSNINSTLGN